MINCIIVDDETHAIELLSLHIEQTPFLKLVGSSSDPVQALQLLETVEVDLIFLDIQMPQMSGLEFMQLLDGKCKVILTTAFREYALDGFDLNVVDYLLKPIFYPRFFKAVQRARDLMQVAKKEVDDFILVKTEYKGKLLKIKINDILYIESKGKYVLFHTIGGDHIMALLNIGNIEEKLSGDQFMRVHKSFVIALSFIVMIQGNQIHLEHTNDTIPIGQTYRDEFMKLMQAKVITNNDTSENA